MNESERETAVVAGVGPGLGAALAGRFAEAGMNVAIIARDEKRLAEVRRAIAGGRVEAYPGDLTEAETVEGIFRRIAKDLGPPDLVVFNAGVFERGGILEIEPGDFERCWRVGCLAGFLVGRAAARAMVGRGSGTIIFTGATASLRGGAGFANLAVPKFGLRALAQAMARELGPKGVHVAHVVIDGQIASESRRHLLAERGPDSLLDPREIAAAYHAIHLQQRSAWTHEADLRPWVERF